MLTFDDNKSESENVSPSSLSSPKFYSLAAIITFILIPPLWILSVPALVFSHEAKAMYNLGNIVLYERFSERTKRFLVSAWAIVIIFAAAVLVLLAVIHLSLI